MNIFELAISKGFPRDQWVSLSSLQMHSHYHKLCGLQAWLRTEHQNYCTIIPFIGEEDEITFEYTNYLLGVEEEIDHNDGPFYTYTEAMQASCLEALNLIK